MQDSQKAAWSVANCDSWFCISFSENCWRNKIFPFFNFDSHISRKSSSEPLCCNSYNSVVFDLHHTLEYLYCLLSLRCPHQIADFDIKVLTYQPPYIDSSCRPRFSPRSAEAFAQKNPAQSEVDGYSLKRSPPAGCASKVTFTTKVVPKGTHTEVLLQRPGASLTRQKEYKQVGREQQWRPPPLNSSCMFISGWLPGPRRSPSRALLPSRHNRQPSRT